MSEHSTLFLLFAGACAVLLAVAHAVSLNFRYIVAFVREGCRTLLPIWALTDLPDSDDYYYFARMQKIVGGHLLNGDPLVFEDAAKPHSHSTYQISLFFCGIFRFFTRSTTACFFGTRLLYPALHFLLLAWAFFLATHSYGLSYIGALVVLNRGGTASNRVRVPNILFTSLHLSLFFLCGFWYWSGNITPWNTLLLAACIAVSPVISLLNAFFVAAAVGVLAAFSLPSLPDHPVLIIATLLLSAPIAFFAMRGFFAFRRIEKYADCSEVYFPKHRFTLNITRQFANRLVVVVGIFILARLTHGGDTTYPLLVSLAALGCVGYVYATKTRHAVTILIERCLTHVTTLAAIFSGYLFIAPYTAGLLGNDAVDALLVTAAVLYAALALRRATDQTVFQYADADKKELTLWAETLSGDEVIVSLDFFAALSLPAYTRAWFYIPQLILSRATDDETWQRLYDVCLLHRVGEREFRDFTERLLPCASPRTPETLPYIAAGLHLTYFQYHDEIRERAGYTAAAYAQGIDFKTWVNRKTAAAQNETPDGVARGWCLPPEVAVRRNREYVERRKTVIAASPLRFYATHVLFGRDAPLVGGLTRASMEHAEAAPVFSNASYAVYTVEAVRRIAALTENTEGADAHA